MICTTRMPFSFFALSSSKSCCLLPLFRTPTRWLLQHHIETEMTIVTINVFRETSFLSTIDDHKRRATYGNLETLKRLFLMICTTRTLCSPILQVSLAIYYRFSELRNISSRCHDNIFRDMSMFQGERSMTVKGEQRMETS